MQQSMKSSTTSIFLAMVAGVYLFCLSPGYAQTPAASAHSKTTAIPAKTPDGTWESLSTNQQKVLSPLESDWDYMLPDSRKKWIQIANIYPKMSSQDQERLQSRMTSWSNLSQKDRWNPRKNQMPLTHQRFSNMLLSKKLPRLHQHQGREQSFRSLRKLYQPALNPSKLLVYVAC